MGWLTLQHSVDTWQESTEMCAGIFCGFELSCQNRNWHSSEVMESIVRLLIRGQKSEPNDKKMTLDRTHSPNDM